MRSFLATMTISDFRRGFGAVFSIPPYTATYPTDASYPHLAFGERPPHGQVVFGSGTTLELF